MYNHILIFILEQVWGIFYPFEAKVCLLLAVGCCGRLPQPPRRPGGLTGVAWSVCSRWDVAKIKRQLAGAKRDAASGLGGKLSGYVGYDVLN
jgi:hypothetical protein